MKVHSKAKHSEHNHCHMSWWGNNVHLWHPDGNKLDIPIWVFIVVFNIALWWWSPLWLVMIGAVVVAWMLGYRVSDKSKRKHK